MTVSGRERPPRQRRRMPCWVAMIRQKSAACRTTNAPKRGARLQDATDIRASLDYARLPWYEPPMIKCSRNVNRNHMTRFGWAVGGVVR